MFTYKTLPLKCFEKTTVINVVPIPRWAYRGLIPLDEPTPDEMHHVVVELPNTKAILGVTIHYVGEPTIPPWYVDGSKWHNRAGGGGGGLYNGNLTLMRTRGCTKHNKRVALTPSTSSPVPC